MQALENLSTKPQNLFILDGLGALLSAFLLGVVLVIYQPYFGIPKNVLYFLALLPCFFAAYDFYVYRFVKSSLATHLKTIAFINLGYCLISIGFAIYHRSEVTSLGWVYIILEILIVLFIARMEYKTAIN